MKSKILIGEDIPSELKRLDKRPSTIDCPFCHTRSVTRVDKKVPIGQAYVSVSSSHTRIETGIATLCNEMGAHGCLFRIALTLSCIFCTLLGVGPGREGVGSYIHYCTRCNNKVALKRPLQEDAEVYGPAE